MDITLHIPDWFFESHPYLILWYVTGLIVSLFWPIKYREGMKGHWWSFFKFWWVHGFFGPLAIISSFPV